jgi:hypothetical protein
VFAFGATYEAEMNKLPGEASELTREAKHRELLGLDDEAYPTGVVASAIRRQKKNDPLTCSRSCLTPDARRLRPRYEHRRR